MKEKEPDLVGADVPASGHSFGWSDVSTKCKISFGLTRASFIYKYWHSIFAFYRTLPVIEQIQNNNTFCAHSVKECYLF